jgi:putative solute:sodium symporter small subunit
VASARAANTERCGLMKLTDKHRAYWRLNCYLTTSLLLIWFGVTFVTGYYARVLNEYTFLGFPLGFYIFSQGAIVVFLIIIGFYVWAMNRLDRRFGVAERR